MVNSAVMSLRYDVVTKYANHWYLSQFFPGLIYCMIKPKAVLLNFVSGKIVLMGKVSFTFFIYLLSVCKALTTQVDTVACSTFRALWLWITTNATLHVFMSVRRSIQCLELFTQCFASSATLSYLISDFLCSLPQWMPLLGLRYTNAISQWPTTTTNGHFISTPSSITIHAGLPGTANFWRRRDKWRDLLCSPTLLYSHLISNLLFSFAPLWPPSLSDLTLLSSLISFTHL